MVPMTSLRDASPAVIRLSDYRAPAWRVSHVELTFDLGIDSTEVPARLQLQRAADRAEPLRLDD